MAFYIVTDGRTNAYGEADSFVVKASGTRQAVKLAPLYDAKNATVEKLEDGRDVPNGVVHSALADFTEDTPAAEDSTLAEDDGEAAEADSFYGTYAY